MPHAGLQFSGGIPFPVAFNSGTVSTIAQSLTDLGFTAAEIAKAKRAIFSVDGGEMHYRYDGGAPTGDIGLMLDDTGGKPIAIVCGETNVSNLQFIKETGGPDVTVSVQLESF